MTDTTQVVTPPVEEKKTPDFIYARDHGRSIRQIVTESVAEPVKGAEEKPEESGTDTDVGSKKEEANPIERSADIDEAAEKAAKKTADAFRKELADIQKSSLPDEEKKKASEELLTLWEKEGRQPKDWKEALSEMGRVSELKALRAFEETQRQKEEAITKERTEKEQAYLANAKAIDERVNADLAELRAAKHLASKEDEKEFIDFAVDITNKRNKENLPVIDPIKMYFLHYKPFKDAQGKRVAGQPAGADAPVAGAKATPVNDTNDKAYVYARDHKKTFRQIMYDAMHRK